ncbi:MAG: nuclear transport factor 2 family protein [Candidatus Cybelea sp.]|jgi:hypothetical protein
MTVNLPAPISAYFSARNAFDIDASLDPFDDNAIVKDEDSEHRGRAAIRAWIEDTTRKYRPTIEPKDAKEVRGETIVSALVSGNFPGSPVLLDHVFALTGEKITRLEIS